jgi:hypothetical protein
LSRSYLSSATPHPGCCIFDPLALLSPRVIDRVAQRCETQGGSEHRSPIARGGLST